MRNKGHHEKIYRQVTPMEETIRQIQNAHQGDKAARDRLVTENTGLVWSIVRRFAGRGYELEDLFQIGSIGLMKAIDKFDTNYEVKFSTYAVPMIAGEIRRFMRDDGMIKVSRSVKELGFKARNAAEELTKILGREPTIEEIAEKTGASREEIAASLEAAAEVDQHREIILRRYFYSQTQTQVAKALNISQVQVSRLEKRILKEMRKRYEEGSS